MSSSPYAVWRPPRGGAPPGLARDGPPRDMAEYLSEVILARSRDGPSGAVWKGG